MYPPLGSPRLDLVLYEFTQVTRWVWDAHLFSHSLLFEMQEWLNDIILGKTLQHTESTQYVLAVFVWGRIFANHILQWWASLVVQMVKNMPTMPETWVQFLSGRSLGEGNGNPFQDSCLENPMTEQPGRLQSLGSQKSQTCLSN